MIPGQRDAKNRPYDLRDHLEFLLQSVNVDDTALVAQRAVELHAFQFSLYYPRHTRLAISKSQSSPKVDMIALARKFAALQLYNYYASRALYKNTVGMKRTPSLDNLETGLARNIKPIEVLLDILKDYLVLESEDRAVKAPLSREGFEEEFRQQISKSKAVSKLIGAYTTNGDELPNTLGRPIGIKIMREALLEAKSVKISQRTLFNYFGELEHTAVFHYLMRTHHCAPVLEPLNHYHKNFPLKIMQRARSVDDLRGVCSMYNTAVTQLNKKYKFNFTLVENVPRPETETTYHALIRSERDPDLTEAIRTVTGHTA